MYPQRPTALAATLELADDELARAQALPESRIGRFGDKFGRAKRTVRQAQHLIERVARQRQIVVVGLDQVAIGAELGQRLGAVHRRHGATEFGAARTFLAHVQQHTIDPAQPAVDVARAARVLRGPARLAVARNDAITELPGYIQGQRMAHLVFAACAVVRMYQRSQLHAALQKIIGAPARQRLHHLADEHRGARFVRQKTKRHPRQIADEAAQLLLAAAQRLLGRLPGRQVGDEAHGHRRARALHPPEGQARRKYAGIAPARMHIAVHRAALGRRAVQQRTQIGFVQRAFRIRRQQAEGLANDLARAPAEHAFRARVEGAHPPFAVDHHHRVARGIDDGALAFLAGLHLLVELAVAQAGVQRHHQPGQRQRDDGNRQRQRDLQRHGGGGHVDLRDRLDETQRRHAGVVHAGNRQAHHCAGQHGQPPGAQAQPAAQPETHPQRQRRQQHRHPHRQHEAEQVITHVLRQLRRRHADVVHRTDARAHRQRAGPEHARAQRLALQQAQRHPGRRQPGQHRQQRQPGIKARLAAQRKGQHADVMHGPDAAAQRQRAGAQRHLAAPWRAGLARQIRQVQRHAGGAHGDQQRQRDQPGVVLRPEQRVGFQAGAEVGVKHGGALRDVGCG